MKKFAMMAAVAVAAMMAAPTAANAQVYANLGYTQYQFDDADAEVGGVTGRVGYNFTPMLGVEGEGTFGVDDDDGVELDSALGGFVVGRLPLSSSFSVHGRVGYQNIEVSTPGGDFEDDGVAWGAGLGWQATPGLGVRADYTRHEGDSDADAISLAGVMNF